MSDIFLHYCGNNPMKPNPSCNNSVIKKLSLTMITRIFHKRLTGSRFIRAPDMRVFLKLCLIWSSKQLFLVLIRIAMLYGVSVRPEKTQEYQIKFSTCFFFLLLFWSDGDTFLSYENWYKTAHRFSDFLRILNPFLATKGHYCRLLITFANSLGPDQDLQNVGPDLEPNHLTL